MIREAIAVRQLIIHRYVVILRQACFHRYNFADAAILNKDPLDFRKTKHGGRTMSSNEADAAKRWRIPEGFWAIVALVAWGLGVVAIIERTPYGLEESTARAILFLWSMSDQVASPIVTLGIPDFRAAYLAPAGMLFSGSLLAIKLCSLLLALAAVLGLYRWRTQRGDTEAPLLASGLLLLAPLTLTGVDTVCAGPFLLLTLMLGAWVDEAYRAARVRFGGYYFCMLVLSMAAVTLHPAGLAYPLVLLHSWWRSPPPEPAAAAIIPGRERTHVMAGVSITTGIGLLLAAGWHQQSWLVNPVAALATDVFGFHSQSAAGDALVWLLGLALLACMAACLWFGRAQWRDDRLARSIALAAAIALFAADTAFSLLVLAFLLYWGYPLLLRVHVAGAAGFVGQRGVAFALLVVLSTVFLLADRAQFEQNRQGREFSPQDQLIQALAAAVQQSHPVSTEPGLVTPEQKARHSPRVASQWPGRTTIACRCTALPLPPASDDQVRFQANLRGIDYVIFDPLSPANLALSRDFALLGGASAETVTLQPGGVLLRLHPAVAPAPDPLPPEPGARGDIEG
jgi:hypothetical protein